MGWAEHVSRNINFHLRHNFCQVTLARIGGYYRTELANGYYRTDLTEHSDREGKGMESLSLSLSHPPRLHSFEDDIKAIGVDETCSTYSEEINSYTLSVKRSRFFSKPATRSATKKKLVLSLVETHQTSTSADGVLHQHVNLLT